MNYGDPVNHDNTTHGSVDNSRDAGRVQGRRGRPPKNMNPPTLSVDKREDTVTEAVGSKRYRDQALPEAHHIEMEQTEPDSVLSSRQQKHRGDSQAGGASGSIGTKEGSNALAIVRVSTRSGRSAPRQITNVSVRGALGQRSLLR